MGKAIKELLLSKTSYFLGGFFTLLLIYTLTRKTVDFYPFWEISREIFFFNADLYRTHTAFSYPPFFFCIIALFTPFTKPVALSLWYLLNLTLLILTVILIIRIFSQTNYKIGKNNWIKVFLPFFLGIFIISDNLYLGQSNILVFFLCTLSIYYYVSRKNFLTGFILAISCAIKITPVLFLVYFIYKKKFKILYGSVAGLLLFFLVIPSLFFGINKNLYFLSDFINLVISPFLSNSTFIRETVYYTHSNQSLDAFLIRHFTDYGTTINAELPSIPLFSITVAKQISLMIKFILVLITWFACRNSLEKKPYLLPLEFAVIFLLILFISPSSWLNHYVSVLFSYYVVINYVFSENYATTDKRTLLFCLNTAVLLTFTGVTPALQSYSGMFLGHFILFLGLLFVLLKP